MAAPTGPLPHQLSGIVGQVSTVVAGGRQREEASGQARGLDPLLLAGIIAQESHFHADVQACLGRGCDLGVAQVNWETWGATLGLDRQRLVHDDDYNVGVAAEILADLRRRHGEEGARWWTRYHDRRPDRRAAYAALVRAHAPVLLGGL